MAVVTGENPLRAALFYALLTLVVAVLSVLSTESAQSQDLRLQYQNNAKKASSGEILPYMRLFNDGPGDVVLSDVTIRYWFTSEPNGRDLYEIYWAEVGASNLVGTFDALGGQRYLEIGFTGGAGTLASGSNTGPIHSRIHDDGWGTYDQTN